MSDLDSFGFVHRGVPTQQTALEIFRKLRKKEQSTAPLKMRLADRVVRRTVADPSRGRSQNGKFPLDFFVENELHINLLDE